MLEPSNTLLLYAGLDLLLEPFWLFDGCFVMMMSSLMLRRLMMMIYDRSIPLWDFYSGWCCRLIDTAIDVVVDVMESYYTCTLLEFGLRRMIDMMIYPLVWFAGVTAIRRLDVVVWLIRRLVSSLVLWSRWWSFVVGDTISSHFTTTTSSTLLDKIDDMILASRGDGVIACVTAEPCYDDRSM